MTYYLHLISLACDADKRGYSFLAQRSADTLTIEQAERFMNVVEHSRRNQPALAVTGSANQARV